MSDVSIFPSKAESGDVNPRQFYRLGGSGQGPLVFAIKLGAALGDRQRVANRAGRGALGGGNELAGVGALTGKEHADTMAPCSAWASRLRSEPVRHRENGTAVECRQLGTSAGR